MSLSVSPNIWREKETSSEGESQSLNVKRVQRCVSRPSGMLKSKGREVKRVREGGTGEGSRVRKRQREVEPETRHTVAETTFCIFVAWFHSVFPHP